MKAYRISEYDWYAADSYEQAIQLAVKDAGEPVEDVVDDMFATGSPEPYDMEIWEDEDRTRKISIGEILAEMSEPGWCFGKET